MAVNIEPELDSLMDYAKTISQFIQRYKQTQQPIQELPNGKYQTLQDAENELKFVLKFMYRLIENCEDGEEAIRQIFGNFRPN